MKMSFWLKLSLDNALVKFFCFPKTLKNDSGHYFNRVMIMYLFSVLIWGPGDKYLERFYIFHFSSCWILKLFLFREFFSSRSDPHKLRDVTRKRKKLTETRLSWILPDSTRPHPTAAPDKNLNKAAWRASPAVKIRLFSKWSVHSSSPTTPLHFLSHQFTSPIYDWCVIHLRSEHHPRIFPVNHLSDIWFRLQVSQRTHWYRHRWSCFSACMTTAGMDAWWQNRHLFSSAWPYSSSFPLLLQEAFAFPSSLSTGCH